ncbi:hypothetical protein PMIN06_007300 [Paraphaeosphaeria minitans]|uniref:RING-type domain-containing protein n=1 Tax=Paraphaeosphaeria minitans TaxID=565426 RepID=A0A9P6GTE4_9PLEO|nr:hypothetical protein PMIN01_01055 [Paraphaeosphaeria minitans]
MTVYNTGAEFGMHGIDHIRPSVYHISRDCDICLEPLDLVQPSANTKAGDKNHNRHHPAVRIKSCGHIHGLDCLKAWLQIGTTCPSAGCGRMLCLPAVEQPLTQKDVDALMCRLRRSYSEDQIARSLARYMHASDVAAAKAEQVLATKIVMDEAKQKEKERKERQECMLKDEDFLDGDTELTEEEDEEDDAHFLGGGEDEDDADDDDVDDDDDDDDDFVSDDE